MQKAYTMTLKKRIILLAYDSELFHVFDMNQESLCHLRE